MDWDSVDWKALERMRERFLQPQAAGAPYWESENYLASYDFTFGRRISWKWSAVLEHVFDLGWKPTVRKLVDWGCGTGTAARSVLVHSPEGWFEEIVLWDHSSKATEFARSAILARWPGTAVQVSDPSTAVDDGGFVLVVSHVLNELGESARDELIGLARRAAAVLWVEPGTWTDSRSLIAVREQLRDAFFCWSPCPHDRRCGMLGEGNRRHWCHHFATPPTEAFTEAGWARFSRLLGIDPRSLPYSHLVLDRAGPTRQAAAARMIGRPRQGRGMTRILACREQELGELELQKRDDPRLWKILDKGRHRNLFELELKENRITGGKPHPGK